MTEQTKQRTNPAKFGPVALTEDKLDTVSAGTDEIVITFRKDTGGIAAGGGAKPIAAGR